MSAYLVNGEKCDLRALSLPSKSFRVEHLQDRLIVYTPEGPVTALLISQKGKTWLSIAGKVYLIEQKSLISQDRNRPCGNELRAPMPGGIVEIFVKQGDTVKRGQKLLVLEAMKTQMPISVPFDGIVKNLHVLVGEQLKEGDLLISLEPI